MGYEVFTEDTFTKSDGIKDLVGKRIDMTWVKQNPQDYVFALEYENTKEIDDEIEKLASRALEKELGFKTIPCAMATDT